MKDRTKSRVTARYTWDRLRVSFWFAPLLMSAAALLLSRVMYGLDLRIPNEMLENSHFVLSGSVGELRTSLVTIATTTLATAGVVFTLLTLPLSTVAAQYGSRLLRLFLGDRTTQLVLGMFVCTFVYCLAAATSIPPVEVQPEAPQLTATVGLLLMTASFGSLILLVQHISTMLQAPNIAATAGTQLLDVVLAEIPDDVRSGDDQRQTVQGAPEPLVDTAGYPVCLRKAGYIQYIDPEAILTLAGQENLVIRLLRPPGHFVGRGAVVAYVWPAGRVDERLDEQIRHAFRLGNQRTPTQDVECAVNLLVEMAVRAMSPAINDPFTAMTCLDHIGEGLTLFIRQGEKSPNIHDRHGQLRLILQPVTFDELLRAAFDKLRHASCDDASVLLHMLEVIDAIGREAESPDARQKLLRHVGLIQAESQAGALIEEDRQLILRRAEALHSILAKTSFEDAA
jgi:uncharacterized membrane protein